MKTEEKMSNYEIFDGLTNPINSEDSIPEEAFILIHQDKLVWLKHLILDTYLTKSEHYKRLECDHSFTVKNGYITLLEIWYNPRGSHEIREEYREEFVIGLPVVIVFKDEWNNSIISNWIYETLDDMNEE